MSVCHPDCDHSHGAHDRMSGCDSRCRCYFAAQRKAEERMEKLVFLESMLSNMRWAWDKSDSRHQHVVKESMSLRAYIESENRRFV